MCAGEGELVTPSVFTVHTPRSTRGEAGGRSERRRERGEDWGLGFLGVRSLSIPGRAYHDPVLRVLALRELLDLVGIDGLRALEAHDEFSSSRDGRMFRPIELAPGLHRVRFSLVVHESIAQTREGSDGLELTEPAKDAFYLCNVRF